MDAVATVLHWGVEVEEGRVVASNFDGFPLLRMGDAPEVEVHFVPSAAPVDFRGSSR